MSERGTNAESGFLYIIATPIGNLDDMSQRAIKVLQQVDLIAAEDTRHSKPMLQHFGINTPVVAMHEHNELQKAGELLDQVQQGKSIAIISDAGTPLISDPGYRIVSEAHARHIRVVPIPGASAATVALCASGLPTDRFVFEGFLPAKQAARLSKLQALASECRTLVFYEAGRRMLEVLTNMHDVFGASRMITVAKELTKHFETIQCLSLAQATQWFAEKPERLKGEFVLVVAGADPVDEQQVILEQANKAAGLLIDKLPAKQLASVLTELFKVPRNQAYQLVLDLKKTDD